MKRDYSINRRREIFNILNDKAWCKDYNCVKKLKFNKISFGPFDILTIEIYNNPYTEGD